MAEGNKGIEEGDSTLTPYGKDWSGLDLKFLHP